MSLRAAVDPKLAIAKRGSRAEAVIECLQDQRRFTDRKQVLAFLSMRKITALCFFA